MRYVTLRTKPVEGEAFHPLGRDLQVEPAIERGSIYRAEILNDGTGLLLAEARGDVDRYREIMDDSDYVYDYSVVADDGWWYAHVHFEPTEVTEEMMRVRYESPLTMDMPIEVEPDGSMVVTLVGSADAFGELSSTVSDAYDVEVVETGDHRPELDDLFLSLTERQRDVLATAVELGYYDNPREATHEDVAREVDASPSTVGEHLRKVEARVFDQLVRGRSSLTGG